MCAAGRDASDLSPLARADDGMEVVVRNRSSSMHGRGGGHGSRWRWLKKACVLELGCGGS